MPGLTGHDGVPYSKEAGLHIQFNVDILKLE